MTGIPFTNAELSVHICPDALGRGKRGGERMGHSLLSIYGDAHTSFPSTQLNPHSFLPSSALPSYTLKMPTSLSLSISAVPTISLGFSQVAWIILGLGIKSRNLQVVISRYIVPYRSSVECQTTRKVASDAHFPILSLHERELRFGI